MGATSGKCLRASLGLSYDFKQLLLAYTTNCKAFVYLQKNPTQNKNAVNRPLGVIVLVQLLEKSLQCVSGNAFQTF